MPAMQPASRESVPRLNARVAWGAVDVFTAEQRSAVMARVRSAGTKPELRLAEVVHLALPRHKVVAHDPSLPGKPDLTIRSLKLVLFVDGCFWHSCPEHKSFPATRQEFWLRKLNGNVTRDRRVDRELRKLGWSVWRVWEHDLTGKRLEAKAARLTVALRRRAASCRTFRSATPESSPGPQALPGGLVRATR